MSSHEQPPSGEACPPEPSGAQLRRDVSVWGSYMWGFADVGADTYAALGLVIVAAQGAAGLAFALAGLVYIMIGLAYTELASAYPVAGGGQYFSLRGLGDFAGFIAGSALLLDYTIDIALFALASAGYINFFFPALRANSVNLGPFHDVNVAWCAETIFLIGVLVLLNLRGMRESSLLNEVVGAIGIFIECAIVILGFALAWKPELLAYQWQHEFPSLNRFMYGSSLAIISFVGLESISQAAQETRRPATIVPRTSLTLIFTVFLFAVAFSNMSLGILPWKQFDGRVGDPVALLAQNIPIIGLVAGPLAALLGAAILLISANSGVMSASRLTYSMSRFSFISRWFDVVHPRRRTPDRTILIFSGIAVVQTLAAFLFGKDKAMDILGNMYAFGATLGYMLVFIAMIRLRIIDPYTPRPYRMPLNIPIRRKGVTYYFPVLGVIGFLGVSTILFEVIWTHQIGRIAGPGWVVLCFIYYAWYRRSQRLRVFRSCPHDWETQQKQVLESAEEFDLLEQYKLALAARDRARSNNKEA
jgi:APA family basic amino acid/polyamine antiporter